MVTFLGHSIRSLARTTLPFLREVHLHPETAAQTDDFFDATVPCQVARRSSVAQGRALLKLLIRVFAQHCADEDEQVFVALKDYQSKVLQQQSSRAAFGHFGVVFGLAGRLLNISLERLCYTFLLSHVKAVLSAAVRLSLIGPYESTSILASKQTQIAIKEAIDCNQDCGLESCGQTFPLVDIWQGRHELLYSRIFSA